MSSGNGSGNEASLEDLKLYIRTLAEAQGEYGRLPLTQSYPFNLNPNPIQ